MPTTLPILMLSGLQDGVIPSTEVTALFQAASTRRPAAKTKLRLFAFSSSADEAAETEYTPPQKDVFEVFPYGGHSA